MDGLRFASLLYIVGFWHLFDYSVHLQVWQEFQVSLLSTFCALGMFFFVSGFLIASRQPKEGWTGKNIRAFYGRRLLRIYPLYFVALNLFFLCGYSGVTSYVYGLFLLLGVFPKSALTLWFVNVIFLFYALAPFFLRMSIKRIVLYTLGLCAVFWCVNRGTGKIDLRVVQYLPAFTFGIIYARSEPLRAWIAKHLWRIGLVLLGAVWVFIVLENEDRERSADYLLVVNVAILACIPLAIFLASKIAPRINQRVLGFLSYASFAAYLFHRIVFLAGLKLYEPPTALTALFYFWGVLLPATLGVAWLLQRACDHTLAWILLWWRRSRVQGR